jgi:hypothetical protein
MEQDAEAAQFLKEASQSVKKNAYFMRKAMVSSTWMSADV